MAVEPRDHPRVLVHTDRTCDTCWRPRMTRPQNGSGKTQCWHSLCLGPCGSTHSPVHASTERNLILKNSLVAEARGALHSEPVRIAQWKSQPVALATAAKSVIFNEWDSIRQIAVPFTYAHRTSGTSSAARLAALSWYFCEDAVARLPVFGAYANTPVVCAFTYGVTSSHTTNFALSLKDQWLRHTLSESGFSPCSQIAVRL